VAAVGALVGMLALRSVAPLMLAQAQCQTVDAATPANTSAAHAAVRRQPTASTFDIADKPLSAFLTWVARQTGRKLVYDGPDAEALAHRVRLHGSIAGLTPDVALAAVLSTTSLRLQRSADDILRVGLGTPIDSATAGRPIR